MGLDPHEAASGAVTARPRSDVREFLVRLPRPLHAALQERARLEGRPMAAIVRDAVSQYLA
jgi:Ribbon-helix-helix protein, copG family